MQNEILLTEAEVARLVRKSADTLKRSRRAGTGPAFIRVGRTPLYRREDVAAWMAANRVAPVGQLQVA